VSPYSGLGRPPTRRGERDKRLTTPDGSLKQLDGCCGLGEFERHVVQYKLSSPGQRRINQQAGGRG